MKHPISRYMMASYAYYVEDDPIISDAMFDQCAKSILEHWDTLDHPHKHLLSKEMLEAGTYLGKYPEIVKSAVAHYRETQI
tara:strand:- start:239 stop:481 length:243 start_codon:yes stop_codon:yes gene_type:complete